MYHLNYYNNTFGYRPVIKSHLTQYPIIKSYRTFHIHLNFNNITNSIHIHH